MNPNQLEVHDSESVSGKRIRWPKFKSKPVRGSSESVSRKRRVQLSAKPKARP
jgi:hypothetical protein